MKIAVIGGGTAGYIAAAHITKHFPEFELYHIYDPTIPTIGVGEGAIPGLVLWLAEITELDRVALEDVLKAKCDLTYKWGIKFENWGIEYEEFTHHFHPIGLSYSYHFSAVKLVEFLKEYVAAIKINKEVINLESNGSIATITFADSSNLEVDIVIDARGFPKSLDEREHVKLSSIPTNAAFIRQGAVVNEGITTVKIGNQNFSYQSLTRSVARPHGWIFIIPLTTRTSYGYVYNSSIDSLDEIKADFDEFLREENISVIDKQRHLNFPNFCCRTMFDGAIFKVGNSAAFLEPLEATAIGIILKQVVSFSSWALERIQKENQKKSFSDVEIIAFNRYLLNHLYRISLFVGWHYAKGSRFNTDFWKFAKLNFEEWIEKMSGQEVERDFKEYLQAASKIIHPFKNYRDFSEFDYQISFRNEKFFEQWNSLSFAEVGCGIGYFS
jgi:tryptophan 7-halogenase